jgi:hypothetical protein
LAIALALELIEVDEAKRRGVDAVPQTASVTRAVREDVSKVAICVRGADLGACHAKLSINILDNIIGIDWLCEAGPSGVAFKLVC